MKNKNANLIDIANKIKTSGLIIFNHKNLNDLLQIKNKRTLFSVLKKLTDNKIILRIERGKYLLNSKNIKTFNIANLIYSPSYISFETALNYHGILSQFPYEITSATTKKSTKKQIFNIHYSYNHLKTNLYFGYEKINNVLIAFAEKALLDQIYLSLKGHKNISINEYDLEKIKKTKLKEFLKKYPQTKQTQKMKLIVNQILDLC